MKLKQPRSLWLSFSPVFLLVLIILLATFSTDVLMHPNLHPRLFGFFHYLTHYHPRLCRLLVYGLFLAYLGLVFLAPLVPRLSSWRMRKNGLLTDEKLRLTTYLNCPRLEKYPLVEPELWQRLGKVLPGLVIKLPDLRAAHWQMKAVNFSRKEFFLELWYVPNPMGIKVSRLYPRKLKCRARVISKGTSSAVEFCFSADSAMDYENVRAIIGSTIAQIKESLEAKADMSGVEFASAGLISGFSR
ncbi:MAG: hypothetical protein JNN26_05200 [Candidatus Obscuribacter sp.]|nr:hypothetical protein [Candidatus Obscuribacter sp.]